EQSRQRVLSALAQVEVAVDAVRRVARPADEAGLASLVADNRTYADEVRRQLGPVGSPPLVGADDKVAGPALDEMQRLVDVAVDPDSAVLLIDLDGFKSINDTWGHEVGDDVLQAIASRLQQTVRGSDYVTRIGGDEFAVLARPALQAEGLRERLQVAISQPLQ